MWAATAPKGMCMSRTVPLREEGMFNVDHVCWWPILLITALCGEFLRIVFLFFDFFQIRFLNVFFYMFLSTPSRFHSLVGCERPTGPQPHEHVWARGL